MINQLFFELIRVAIGTQDTLSRPPSKAEWAELYAMSKKQSLVGICFAAVQKLNNNQEPITQNLDEVQYLTWMGMAAKIQQRNEVMNHRCIELQEKLHKDGFLNCILKGQGIGALYRGLSMLRQSGDIDVWLDADMDTIIKYVQAECPNEQVDVCGKHIEFRLYKDVEIEAHFIPGFVSAPIYSSRMKFYYGKERGLQMKKAITLNDGSTIVVPDNKFQVIQILNHVFTHFVFEGAGMRQVMDYYYAVIQPLTELEKDEIVTLFRKTGLFRFAKAMSYVVKEVFSYEVSFIPSDEKYGRMVLRSIMAEGNFGKHDSKRDNAKMRSSLYRYCYHTKRQISFIGLCPMEVLWHPIDRLKGYLWRLSHGYFK